MIPFIQLMTTITPGELITIVLVTLFWIWEYRTLKKIKEEQQ